MERDQSPTLPGARFIAAILFASALALAASSGVPAEVGRQLPADSVDAHLAGKVRALMANAVPVFAWRFDRPLLRAAADGNGRFVLVLGGRTVTVVGIGQAGEIRWQHELFTPRYNPMMKGHPDFLEVGLNGSAHLVYGVWEEVGRHVVIDPEGHIALDDTLDAANDGGWALALSPCGQYYYMRLQGAEEIEIHRVKGEAITVDLPRWRGSGSPQGDISTNVTSVANGLFVTVTRLEHEAVRRCLIDLSQRSPTAIQIEVPFEGDPRQLIYSDYATTGEDLLVCERWEHSPTCELVRYGPDGRVRWRMIVDQHSGRVVPARDRAMAVFMTYPGFTRRRVIKTIDTGDGAVLDSALAWPGQSGWSVLWIHERSFDQEQLLMAVHGGRTGNEAGWVRVEIDSLGRVGTGELREDWVWGLSRDQPLFGIAVMSPDSTWTVAGFRK